jgi:hypothetical protein
LVGLRGWLTRAAGVIGDRKNDRRQEERRDRAMRLGAKRIAYQSCGYDRRQKG